MSALLQANEVTTKSCPTAKSSSNPEHLTTQVEGEIFRSVFDCLNPLSLNQLAGLSDAQILQNGLAEIDRLLSIDRELEHFASQVYRASVLDELTAQGEDVEATIRQNATRAVASLPSMNIDVSVLQGLRSTQLVETLSKLRLKAVWQHTVRVRMLCDFFVEIGMAGSMQSFNSDDSVCSFTRCRIRFRDEVLERTQSQESKILEERYRNLLTVGKQTVEVTTTTEEADIQTDVVLEKHHHEIVDCYQVPLHEPIAVPSRIEELRNNFLPTLTGCTKILFGELLRHQMTEEPLSTHKSRKVSQSEQRSVLSKERDGLTATGATAAAIIAGGLAIASLPFLLPGAAMTAATHVDPALIIGGNHGYVLAGWLPEEVTAEKKARLRSLLRLS